jgi:hypothetical protein
MIDTLTIVIGLWHLMKLRLFELRVSMRVTVAFDCDSKHGGLPSRLVGSFLDLQAHHQRRITHRRVPGWLVASVGQ